MDPLEALASASFCRVADAQQSNGNAVQILKDGPETFAAWLEAIGGASRTVDLENYILQDDPTGARFAEALLAAAARGVACRVLYDWLGCRTRTPKLFWERLRAGGVQVRVYNPPQLANPLRWISRDHRKVLCVDGTVAFTGGLCIGHDWMGDPARGIPPWRDTAVRLQGPAVSHLVEAFEDSWEAVAHNRLGSGIEADLAPAPAPGPDAPGGIDVSVIAGRPERMALYRLEQLVAEIAQHRLWLTDGYFVATTAYVRALAQAAQAGVDVRLLVPGSSDWPIVGALSKTAYRPLLEAGVRVFEWNGPMVHAKTAVADGCWTRIGSSNSNLASWIGNRELDVTIKDHDLARQMEAMFEDDMRNATEVVLARGQTGVERPVMAQARQGSGRSRSSSRFLSGAIGLGSTLTASFTRRRQLRSDESLVVFAGGAALVVLAVLVLLLPHLFSWLIAIIAVWSAAGMLTNAARLWGTGAARRGA
jgi:cardiolipin synthase